MTEDAARNLETIHDYINEHYDSARAVSVLEHLEAAIERLVTDPERGSYP